VSDPISIYAKYLECEIKDIKKELVTQRELANRLEEENADIFLRRWAKAQERAIDAERELKAERALADRFADALLSTFSSWVMSPKSEQLAKCLATWKEARNES